MILRYVTLTMIVWGYTTRVMAQHPQGNNYPLTTANGLPNSTVTGIGQDRAGFIWIATADGLARYDGRQLSVFRHHDQSNALLENNISRLQSLANGTFLLQTHTGDFQLFDPITERFTTFLPLAKQGKRKMDDGWLAPDGKTFWGLWRGEKIQFFDHTLRLRYTWDECNLGRSTAKTLHTIVPAANGLVYAHFDEGLVELNPRTGQHRILLVQLPSHRRINQRITVQDWKFIAERPNGEIIVIGQQDLRLLNPRTGYFRNLSMPTALRANQTYALRVLADGKVFITGGNQLYELLPDDRFILVYEWKTSLSGQKSYGVPYLNDRSGLVWLYTQMSTVIRFDPRDQPFHAFGYRTDWKSDLLRAGLGVEPPSWEESSGDSWTRFTYANSHLWFIDLASLYRCDAQQHRLGWASSRHRGDRCACKIALKPDQGEHLWVYGNEEGGLMELDAVGRVNRLWPNSLVPQPLENRGLDVADIQPMGSVVWLASYQGKGLYKYDLRQKKIVGQWLHNPANNQSLPTNQLLGLLADPYQPTRVLWIGTLGEGLTRFDTQTGQFRTFSIRDGLPDNTIHSLQRDRKGFIWAATNKGLVRLDARSFGMRVFTQADGLQDDEFVFAASAQLPGGRLAFGSRTGMTVFDPTTIQEQTSQTPVVLSALRINNERVESNTPNSPLTSPINALTALTLDYTQNFLTFEFAGLQYNKPETIHYQYRLTGVDPNWVDAGTQNTANYTQLQAGRYTFEVMTTNTDGQWSQLTKRLVVVITPPFWATWWAYSAYLLSFGGLVFGFIRLRINRIRDQQEVALKRREADQLKAVDELKTRFFSNITHEFRTPLALILSPTEKLLQEPKHDASTRQTLTSVQRNAGQLLLLINQLLDLSKLEAGGMAVSLARGNVAEFIEQWVDSFRPVADQKGVALTFRADTVPNENLFDADKWATIITNLLANALKFTPTGKQVAVEMRVHSQAAIHLTIADTGIGIPAEKLPHIFDRFYQVDDTRTRAYEGTGIGLSLVNELIGVLGGTIAVESQPGKGTTFTVQLPVLPTLASTDVPTVVLPAAIKNELTYLHDRSDDAPAVAPTSSPLVLVVEDNAELRRFIADELFTQYRILTATNGQEGWNLAQTELPDVVISDIMMPEMDGYELTRHLKTSPVTNHIAVMLLTARASHESRMEGLTQGADDYLIKPFHVDELHQRLHNLLTRQQTLRTYYQQLFTQPDADFRPETMEDEFLRQLHTAIEAHLAESTFGVEELARGVGMSRRTLDRKLAVVANQSANDIIRQHRLKRAAQLLLAGHNVSETTYLVGYESPAHFSLIFKEFFQKSPTEYTRQ